MSDKATSYMPQLDGIRAIAVAMVAVFHWHHPTLLGGGIPLFYGVDIFFVLSGFLITRILVDVRDRIDGASGAQLSAQMHALKAFWARRFLRLVPAVVVYLAVAVALGYTSDNAGLLWYLGYLGNFRIVQLGQFPQGTAHLWSLAVEEQFYILMPLVVLWLPRRSLRAFFTIGIGASVAAAAMGISGLLPPAAFTGLFIGCLAALWFDQYRDNPRIASWCALGTPALVLALGIGTWVEGGLAIGIANDLFLNVAAAAVTWRAALGLGGRVLEHPIMIYLGRMSYGLYLWHFLAMAIATRYFVEPTAHWLTRLTLATVLTLVFAAVSDVYVERRFTAKKSNFPYVASNREEPASVSAIQA